MIETKKTFEAGETAYLATETGAEYIKAVENTRYSDEFLVTEIQHIDKDGNSVDDYTYHLRYKPEESRFCTEFADALDLSIKLAKADADEDRKMYHRKLAVLFDLKGQRIALRDKQRVAELRAKARNELHSVQLEKMEC